MLDFSARGLPAKDRSGTSDPYLKIDFDNFKLFKTDKEVRNLNPQWGFQKRFTYRTKFLDKLQRKRLKISCYDHNMVGGADFIGETSVDLFTLATGPRYYTLTLKDQQKPAGTLKFICVMKMMSEVTVSTNNLSLTLKGQPAGAAIHVFPSMEGTLQAQHPYSPDGKWSDPKSMTFETTLWDLVGPEENEHLRFQVLDQQEQLLGEAVVSFCEYFKMDGAVSFQVPVRHNNAVVGELTGEIEYSNCPKYAQLAGGSYQDHPAPTVQGGFLLLAGIPFPNVCQGTPPTLPLQAHRMPLQQAPEGTHDQQPDAQDTAADRPPADSGDVTGGVGMEGMVMTPNTGQGTIGDQIQQQLTHSAPMQQAQLQEIQAQWDYMEEIELPPNWEMRKDRRTGRPYFADHRSKCTCWTDPRFLPENWDQRIDPNSGRVYYAYHKTRQTTFIDPRGLSHGWEMRLSPQGEVYFAYHPTRKTTYVDPRGLPPLMSAALDTQGRCYFKNHETKSTQWEDPRETADADTLARWREEERERWWYELKKKTLEELKQEADEAAAREDMEMLNLGQEGS
ncbi:unnamed protein product [Vitrella brassicaformis CCMP3155]|uniref:WW domain-containing protein n=1 Tax=Vitrella brassicaformis (strain CCMP3155) TaxID=1169540 RepID=A0A0G4ECB1_VITBC|nr:unnamed protein product [Vitrella brassicaformis CCMP3155]|eukprot:CEL93571.1 unnamed protein product [Vitrella brassicaformis CCMP3155]